MASADRNGEAANSARLGAMTSLLGRLDKLTDRGGISQLRDDLCNISDKLRNLSELRDPPLTVKYWMKHARELSYDMEDYLDNSDSKMEDTIDDSDAKKNKISGFRTRVEGMIERYDRFNLDSFGKSATATTTLVSQHLSLDGVPVGMEDQTNKLRSLLEPKGDGEYNKKLKIVSILGVEGVGKSMLIQELWRLESEQNFECRAFVRSAKTPDIRMILRSILSQICLHEKAEDSRVTNLIRDIKNHLQNKRYFIIIDDLWDVSVWDVIGRAFPDSGVGSRIITTTTDKDVAQACCSYDHEYVYKMEPLKGDESRKLFIRTVGSAKENPELSNDVSEAIERKCGGLPLSIIWAAILVANQPETKQKLFQLEAKQELSKAQKEENLDSDMKTSLENKLRKNSTPVQILNQLLKLCYNSLPHYLKTCLLYLSVYPENYLILKADLVKLWIAEGFICTSEGEDKFEVAGSYFDILVSLGMIQRININCNKQHHQGEVKILRISNMVEVEGEEDPLRLPYVVHPTVFNFIACKSMEDNFITIIDSSQSKVALKDKIRRLSLHFGSATYAPTLESTALSQARTLSFMGLQRCMPSLVLFKLVRVLILHLWADNGDPTFSLAKITELLLLRYLQVQCNATVELPLKIGCMEQLETLEIKSRVAAVPLDILYLPRLLHVCFGEKTNLTLGPISSVKAISSDELLPPMDAPCSKSPPSVQIFEVLPSICIFPRLPEWIPQLYKLSILEIAVRELWTSESECDIGILAKLPALTALSLYVRTPTEGNIIFRQGAFPALEYFKFMCGVLLLDFQEEAAPNLRILKIGFNIRKGQKYGNILVGIQHLLKLEEVAASIGATTGAEKYDRIAAEYALKDAISVKQPCPPKLNVKWVHQLEEERRPPTIASPIIGTPYPVASQITNVDPLTLMQPVNEQDEVPVTRGMPAEDSTSRQPINLGNVPVKEKNERASLRITEFSSDLPKETRSKMRIIAGPAINFKLHLLETITNNFSEKLKVGCGAYGNVYRAIYNGEEIAVKKFDSLQHLDDKAFVNELCNHGMVHHQNIVRLIGYSNETRDEYVEHKGELIRAVQRVQVLCFEYVHGGSLDEHISDGYCDLDWPTCYKIIKGICEGLNHLHNAMEQPILHLDLKPANILLDKNMTAKIGDFGLSRLVSSTEIFETLQGTRGFMPPEYVRSGYVSTKFDVFSLGVIILKIIAGNTGYFCHHEMPEKQFIELVTAKWKLKQKLQGKWRPASQEIEILGVKTCVEIGLRCVKDDRKKRPSIEDIISELGNLEDVINKRLSLSSNQLKDLIGQGSSDFNLLSVDPSQELRFLFEPRKDISYWMQLTNKTDGYTAFNIKINQTKYYAEPSKGILPPCSRCYISVTLLAQEAPPDIQCDDMLLIQGVNVSKGLTMDEITEDFFENAKVEKVVDVVKLPIVCVARDLFL